MLRFAETRLSREPRERFDRHTEPKIHYTQFGQEFKEISIRHGKKAEKSKAPGTLGRRNSHSAHWLRLDASRPPLTGRRVQWDNSRAYARTKPVQPFTE